MRQCYHIVSILLWIRTNKNTEVKIMLSFISNREWELSIVFALNIDWSATTKYE